MFRCQCKHDPAAASAVCGCLSVTCFTLCLHNWQLATLEDFNQLWQFDMPTGWRSIIVPSTVMFSDPYVNCHLQSGCCACSVGSELSRVAKWIVEERLSMATDKKWHDDYNSHEFHCCLLASYKLVRLHALIVQPSISHNKSWRHPSSPFIQVSSMVIL